MITSMLLFFSVLKFMLSYKSRFCRSKFYELQKHFKPLAYYRFRDKRSVLIYMYM